RRKVRPCDKGFIHCLQLFWSVITPTTTRNGPFMGDDTNARKYCYSFEVGANGRKLNLEGSVARDGIKLILSGVGHADDIVELKPIQVCHEKEKGFGIKIYVPETVPNKVLLIFTSSGTNEHPTIRKHISSWRKTNV
ncbi:hypothetical protein MKW98_025177, partial [Papaver atlanticum]